MSPLQWMRRECSYLELSVQTGAGNNSDACRVGRWASSLSPPDLDAPGTTLVRSSPLVRGFFLPHRSVSSFRGFAAGRCCCRGTLGARNISSGVYVVGHLSRHLQNSENAMKLRSFATVAFILIPSLAYAAGGGGTGISNAGNGDPSGANSDASNGNTPVGPAGANVGNSATDRAGKSGTSGSMGTSGTGNTDVPATMGTSKEMKRQNGEPQKAP
jgi:hypothetical protein